MQARQPQADQWVLTLSTFCSETGGSPREFQRRWAEISRQLRKTGSYRHTPQELAFGARIAWRNHGRCIGRLFWESLEVFDCRDVTDPTDIAAHVAHHMRTALGDGRIRSLISVFAPVLRSALPAYIESQQITQYAGYTHQNGTVTGDRQNVEATRIALALGWSAPENPGRFDLLPFIVRDEKDRRHLFSLPADCVREVSIKHPNGDFFDSLGLKWYAVPCVSGMILSIGGIDYPCAPFNGFYMSTEIASRNLVDRRRYDLLPEIGRALELPMAPSGDPLWKDVALTELNRAVLHSFDREGVTMLDHHAASAQFMEFHQREQSRGRRVAGDWRWIVPPQAPSATDVFHLRMKNFSPVPNYYNAEAEDGRRLMPFYGDQHQSRLQRSIDRIMRRWKLWKRMAW